MEKSVKSRSQGPRDRAERQKMSPKSELELVLLHVPDHVTLLHYVVEREDEHQESRSS